MDILEMQGHLEQIARNPDTPPSARVRAIEVLARLNRQHPPEEQEWAELVRQFAPDDVD